MMKIKKRIKEIFSNKFNVILIAIVAIFTIYYAGFIANKLSGVRCFYNNSDSVSYVDISTPKIFSLSIKTDNLSAIQFPFIIENKDLTDDELKKIKFDINIEGVKNLCFTTDVLSNGAGEHFLKIFLAPRISNKNNKNLDVTVSCAEGVSFLKNDAGNIIYKLNGLKKIVITGAVILFILFIAFCYFVIYATRNWKFENRFLLYALVLGLAYIFVRAPLTAGDEFVHYDTAYNMSNIMMGYGSVADNGTLLKRQCDLDLLPGYYPDFYIMDYPPTGWILNGGRAFYKHFFENLGKAYDLSLVSSLPDKVMKSQRAFIFSSAAISLSRLLKFNQFFTYYSGCFINLIITILLVYFGIKVNKNYQYIFASISLVPVCLIKFGSYCYDSLVIALSFFIINLAFSIHYGNKKNYKFISLYIVASLFLFPMKLVYFVIPLLLIFLLFYTHNLNRKLCILIGSAVLAYIVLFILAKFNVISFITSRSINDWYGQPRNLFGYSLQDVIAHTASFFSLIVSKIVEQDWDDLITYSPLYVPALLRYCFYIAFILLLFKSSKEVNNNTVFISSFTVFIIIFFFLCMVSIRWTHYGEFSLWGFPSRYLLPILPLLFISLRNTNISNYIVDEKVPFYLSLTGSLFFVINIFVQNIFWVGSVE